MLIFVISVILVSFISLCFFKNNFWENRYLVLTISGGVALVATLSTNFVLRTHLETKLEIMFEESIEKFYITNPSLVDSCVTFPLKKNFNFFGDYNSSQFWKDPNDSLNKQIPIHILFYTHKGELYVGYIRTKNEKQWYYKFKGDDLYIEPSTSDTIAYISKKKLIYDIKPNNWVSGFSLPRIKTIRVLYIPPKEYKMIPDSLQHKTPF